MPRVSVLMPVYNAAPYVEQAIQSILLQTYRDFKLIVIDDGSCDGSIEVISSFTDSRIHILRNSVNRGIEHCLNMGLETADGEYIARMDADDYSLPDRLSAQVNYLDGHPDVGVCGTGYLTMQNETVMLPEDPEIIKCTLLLRNCLAHPTVMLRRALAVHNEASFYNDSYRFAEDYHLWVKLSRRTRLVNLPEVHLLYRSHSNQISNTYKYEQQKQVNRIILEQLYELGLNPTPEEEELHHQLHFPMHPEDKKRDWLNSIFSQNLKMKIYDQNALMYVLTKAAQL